MNDQRRKEIGEEAEELFKQGIFDSNPYANQSFSLQSYHEYVEFKDRMMWLTYEIRNSSPGVRFVE